MMKMNFSKRLESSVKSFEITMGRTIGKIEEPGEENSKFHDARPIRIRNPTIGIELGHGRSRTRKNQKLRWTGRRQVQIPT